MSLHNLDVAAFVEEPPEFTYEGGLFHIRQRFSASCVVERVMSPHIFMLSLRRAAETARQHRLGSAEIIDFPQPEDEVASAH